MNKEEFIKECEKINIEITKNMIEKLDIYRNLLSEYNSVMNLTNITEEKEVYLKHYYDSLCLIKAVDLTQKLSLCDVGTGAGFPGIVLKIVFPNLSIILIEPLQKRCKFLETVINSLKLKDIEIINDRAETYAKTKRENFDIVTSRAVSRLRILSEISIPLVKINGYFIPYKGNVEEEIKESEEILKKLDSKIEKIINYTLPIENSNRNLIKIQKKNKTNTIYPRNYGIIKKS